MIISLPVILHDHQGTNHDSKTLRCSRTYSRHKWATIFGYSFLTDPILTRASYVFFPNTTRLHFSPYNTPQTSDPKSEFSCGKIPTQVGFPGRRISHFEAVPSRTQGELLAKPSHFRKFTVRPLHPPGHWHLLLPIRWRNRQMPIVAKIPNLADRSLGGTTFTTVDILK